jgi:hypothetical protein
MRSLLLLLFALPILCHAQTANTGDTLKVFVGTDGKLHYVTAPQTGNGTVYYSAAQSVTVSCPNGIGTSSYTVLASQFSSTISAAAANQVAHDTAVARATRLLVCSSNAPPSWVTVGNEDDWITITKPTVVRIGVPEKNVWSQEKTVTSSFKATNSFFGGDVYPGVGKVVQKKSDGGVVTPPTPTDTSCPAGFHWDGAKCVGNATEPPVPTSGWDYEWTGLSFDQSSTLLLPTLLNFGTDVTVMFRAKFTNKAQEFQAVCGAQDNSGGYLRKISFEYNAPPATNYRSINFGTDNESTGFDPGASFDFTVWHEYRFQYTGGVLTVDVDGRMIGSRKLTGNFVIGQIGGGHPTTAYRMNGDILWFRIKKGVASQPPPTGQIFKNAAQSATATCSAGSSGLPVTEWFQQE